MCFCTIPSNGKTNLMTWRHLLNVITTKRPYQPKHIPSSVALTVFKYICGMAPTYISDCFTICNEVAIRDTRNATSTNLVTLPYAILCISRNSFAYRGSFIWIVLPDNIRKYGTLSGFKRAIKVHVLNV